MLRGLASWSPHYDRDSCQTDRSPDPVVQVRGMPESLRQATRRTTPGSQARSPWL